MSVKSYEVDRASHEQLGPDGSYCFEHNDCILKHFVESIKANMAAGLVMLRLILSIVASLGSTTGEMPLLSWRRPVPSRQPSSRLTSCSPTTYPGCYCRPRAWQGQGGQDLWSYGQ
jgi:hypothetical protein